MKIEFNSNDDLSLNKTLELHNMTIAVGVVFYEGNNYRTQLFSDECLYNL